MPAAKRPSASEPKYLPWAIAGLLLLAIGIVFGQTLSFDFLHYDDPAFVTACGPVLAGPTAPSLRWIFTNGPNGDWYPLAMLSHMLDVELFGLHAGGHYATNVLLHAATVVGLFLLLRQMTSQRAVPGTDRRLVVAEASGARAAPAGPSATNQRAVPTAAQASGVRAAPVGPSATNAGLWPSAMVAALLAVHPQHVESVAWIAERRDVLSGVFFVLTLAAYLGYVRRGRPLAGYLLVAVLLGLGLMAKPMLVTVPALLLLLDYWPLGRFGQAADLPAWVGRPGRESFGRLVVEKLPLAALALADCVATIKPHATASVPWNERVAEALISPVTYLVHLFYPLDLAAFYPYADGGEPAWKALGSAAALVAISAAAVWLRRQYPYLFVGWFWFLGMLVPVSGLVQISLHARADRYMYLPGIGLYIALAFGVWRWAAASLARRRAVGVGAALVVAVLVALATRQTSFWRDDASLWAHSADVTGPNFRTEAALGEMASAAGQFDEATIHFRRSLEQRADPQIMHDFGMMLFFDKKLDEAAAMFRRALEQNPRDANTIGNLGAVLAEQGQAQEAANHYLLAIEIDPMQLTARLNLVRLLARHGQFDEAIKECQDAIAIAPQEALPRQILSDLNDMKAGRPKRPQP